MEQGWVKLHRKSMESTIWKNPMIWFVWSWCLMKANHKDNKFPFNGKDIVVKNGSFIMGQIKAQQELPTLSRQNIRTALDYLKSTSRITIESTNKFSVITILKWKEYQQENQQTNQPLTNEQPATNQPLTTNKNVKNVKNDKKIAETSSASKIFSLEEKLLDMEKVPNSVLDIIASFIREKPVSVENSKQLSAIITRYGRVAKLLSGAYTNEQIFGAVKKIKNDNAYRKKKGQQEVDFTLETVAKQLMK